MQLLESVPGWWIVGSPSSSALHNSIRHNDKPVDSCYNQEKRRDNQEAGIGGMG